MSRPLTPLISRQRAAAAALNVIDRESLRKFNLAEVARHLGVSVPSLYHHFHNKDELLAEVARLLLERGPLPPIREETDWREELVQICVYSWRTVLVHPEAAPLLLQFFPRTLLVGAYEYWCRLLAKHKVPVEWHIRILEGTDKLTWGSALFHAANRLQAGGAYSYDPARHRYLAAAVEANPLSDEQIFEDNVRSFLRGLPLD